MSIFSDYHLHTHHSGDSEAPMEEMVTKAIGLGLKEMCFTEHMDLDYPTCYDLPPEPFTLDVKSYREEVQKYKEVYKDKISIKFGVEIGMQPVCLKANQRFIKENDFDFVIASIHLIDAQDPYYESFWTKDTVENLYKRYFDITLENIKLFTDFDVLGHLDYMSRYAPEGDHTYSYERFKDQIDEILKYLVENGKGLDFNSKSLKKSPDADPNPSPAIMKRFKELGGSIITFGSDAHYPEGIACGFDKMRDIALSCGFTEYYTFESRTPIAHKL
jgi:histidinol-phosphatase (PHP family)